MRDKKPSSVIVFPGGSGPFSDASQNSVAVGFPALHDPVLEIVFRNLGDELALCQANIFGRIAEVAENVFSATVEQSVLRE
jgi:hypothetical protein